MIRIRVERALPAPGEILVQVGEWVEAARTIARTPTRGEIQVVNVARILGLDSHDVSRVMLKKRGDRVETGEILAARRGALPFLHKPCRSPMTGRLVAIGHGWLVIEGETDGRREHGAKGETIDLPAFVAGQVAAIRDRRSVTIETTGTHIVGACGLGGEGYGILQVAVKDPAQTLGADDIGMGANNAILVGGAGVSPEALDRARDMKVKGIIVGGISSALHDLRPAPPFPIVATEGYGNLPMSSVVFDILKQREGHQASLSEQMSEAWSGCRPAILIPRTRQQPEDEGEMQREDVPAEPARVGPRVRVVRRPLLGQVGEITSVLAAPQRITSGLSLPGARVVFARPATPSFQQDTAPEQDVGRLGPLDMQFVPWLNLERID